MSFLIQWIAKSITYSVLNSPLSLQIRKKKKTGGEHQIYFLQRMNLEVTISWYFIYFFMYQVIMLTLTQLTVLATA